MVSIQETKNSNSNEKKREQQQQQQRQIFIMFRSRGKGHYYSLKERYHRYNNRQEQQQLPLYHLSYRFNAETFRTRTLCKLVHWIDWGTPFEILTIDDIAAAIIQNKQEGIAERLICKRCILSLAHRFTDQEQAEISRIYDDDKKEKSQSRILNQSQK